MSIRSYIELLESAENLSSLQQTIDNIRNNNEIYLHGRCHILAIALARVSGKPLEAAIAYDEDVEQDCLVHAWVRWDNHLVLDLGGLERDHTILTEFPLGDEAEIVPMDAKALMRLGGGSAKLVNDALPLARTLCQIAQKQAENGWKGM